jgi:uncharacterized membrane protein YgcG
MPERDEEDARVSGVLRVTLGGRTVDLPILKIRPLRRWTRLLEETDFDLEQQGGDERNPLDRPMDIQIDLIVGYDQQGVLGGREHIEDVATAAEVDDIFDAVLTETFPQTARVPLAERLGRLVVAAFFSRGSSTNGRSRTGASTRTRSRSGSRTGSSGPSGTRGGSGS